MGLMGPHPNAVALLVDPVADVVGEELGVAGGLAAGGGACQLRRRGCEESAASSSRLVIVAIYNS